VAFLLPALPLTADVVGEVVNNNASLRPTGGKGRSQTLLRPGRFAVSVNISAQYEACANEWLAVHLRHLTEGPDVRLAWPRDGVAGLPAGAKVDGAGQTGALLAVKGLDPGQVIKVFTPFSFISGGVSYMHRNTVAVVADGAGKATLSIGPVMRVSPADNLALNFTAPIIEGELDTGPLQWTFKRWRTIGLSFKITER
jgi:hypothetical protein